MLFKNFGSLMLTTLRQLSSLPRSTVLTPFQEQSLNEECIIVNKEDKVLGSASKLECHRVQKDGSLILHRAFSVFLFNTKGEILLQQRSSNKVTFPNHVSNACCSHPLFEIDEEKNEADNVGVKLAAIRRLNIELGIPKEQISVDDFHYITRFIYQSVEDSGWGEHELDYILFLIKDVDVCPNPEEISFVKYVAQKDFNKYVASLNYPLSPWFQLCTKNFLNHWWNNLNSLDKIKDHSTIHILNK